MNRRELLALAGALGLAPDLARAATDDAKGAARDAWLYALPLIEMATTRARVLKAGGRVNRLGHARVLADHTARAVTTPNTDTLYSIAWLDLSQGPLTLTIPACGDRYYSVAVMDMFTNNNAVLSTRTVGGAATRVTLVGPGQASPPFGGVRVATPHAWLLVRLLVDGPDDLAAAHALQDGFTLAGGADAPPPSPTYAERDAPAGAYFAAAQALIQAEGYPPTDLAVVRRAGMLLVPPVRGSGPVVFPPDEAPAIAAGVAEAQLITRLAKGRQVFVQGWAYPRPNLGDYGQDYVYRAVIALQGLGALPVAEAMYLRAAGDDGAGLFTGDGPYRLSLPATLPVDGFWSLSMYEATADGQLFFTDNPLRRYAIGDRTPGLVRNPDGTLDLWIGRGDPGGARTVNWLPAPKAGPFTMILRAYRPRPELLDGRFRLPPVARA